MSPDEGKVLQTHEGKGRRLNKPKRVAAFVFISPAVLFLVVFSVIPMLYSFGISFFHYNTSMNADTIRFIGLKNYVSVLTNKQFLDSACWTFIFTVSAVALNLLFGMTLAVVLTTNFLPRISKVMKTVFTIPMMIAPIVIATIWKLMFSPIYGVLNGLLVSMGLDRVEWLSAVVPARIALVIVEVWATTPLCMLIFMAALNLYPCAYSMTFNVSGNTLNGILNQRSQDMLTANSWNVCQYAVLLHMLAQVSGLKPGELVHVIADAHIYDRHIPMVEELLKREPYPGPTLSMDTSIQNFYQFTTDSFRLEHYQYHTFSGKIPVAI